MTHSVRAAIPSVRVAGLAVFGAIALVTLFGGAARAAPPAPSIESPHGGGVKVRLEMQIGSGEVTAWLYVPPAPEGTSAAASGVVSTAGSAASGNQGTPLPVLFYSGEWGWTQIHEETAARLARQGRYVLGLDTTTYFQNNAEAPVLAADFETFRATLNSKAGRAKDAPLLLVGFGYGAEMIPYVLNRAGLRGVQGALLMAPDQEGAKMFRVSIQLKIPSSPAEAFNVGEEIRRMPPIPVAFLDGGNDDRAQGRTFFKLVKGPRKYVPIPGADHQFHDARDIYLEQVANCLRWLETQTIGARPLEPGGGPS